jgi:hypothetical protein
MCGIRISTEFFRQGKKLRAILLVTYFQAVKSVQFQSFLALILFSFIYFLSFHFWCWDRTQGLTHARQALYHQTTSHPYVP